MERSSVDEKYKWKVTDIYANDEEWEKHFANIEKEFNFSAYKGKLNDKKTILDCLKKQNKIDCELNRLFLYAHMRHDEDTRNAKYTSYQSMVYSLSAKLGAELSFFEPEISALSNEFLNELKIDDDFKDYDYYFKELIKNKKYILSAKEERLLALSGETMSSFKDIFSMIDNAELPLGEIEDTHGDKIQLSHGVYGTLLHSKDRVLRERAFKKYYSAYIGLINTISSNYYGNVKKDVFFARARGFDSCLQRALNQEDVDVCVYENLLKAVNESLPSMHEYVALRKEILGYDELHMYDIYAPLVEDAELSLEYDDAYDLVVKGLAPLGEEYTNLLLKGKNEGWIDVFETIGKRSGAYSTGIYGLHPFVLLNYQKTTHDIFTIAHEMGHSIHTYFSNKNQPSTKADYKIFVAEVASTVNEVLLLKHIVSTTKDEKLKKYLLSYYLDTIRTTLHRQTMFAEFESVVHTLVEQGTPLTKENMCEEYLTLNKKYYGDAIVHDEEISYEWCRIPHFYTSFYVYKYATGIISAISIVNKILSGEKNAKENYFKFLSSGGSDSPVELLKLAGVDLTKTDVFNDAMQDFKNTLAEFKALSLGEKNDNSRA